MGRLIVSTQMTLDGVIDVGEWYVAEGKHDRAGKDHLVHASAVLLGRKTYEGLAAYWSPLTNDWAKLDQPDAEVRRVPHTSRSARVECDAPRRRGNRRGLETQGRASFPTS
jgi:RibD C-terminal domain